MKTNNFGQWMIASLKISTDEQNNTEQNLHLITTNTVTIPPYHISLFPLKAINQAINTKIQSGALLEIDENPFLTIEQPEMVLHTNITKSRVQNTRCIHGSTVEPRWSNCDIEKKHDHWLCKGIG